ncbi:MAG: Rrf2 family transcriptional regulator [Verrucomicrobiota bacterium]
MNLDFSIALHVVGYLTARAGKPLTSEALAETYGTSPVVVRRVLSKLNKAGLVASRPGSGGGSILACPPHEINLRQVYQATNSTGELLKRPPENGGPVTEVMSHYLDDLFADAEEHLLKRLEQVTVAGMDATVRPKLCRLLAERKIPLKFDSDLTL